MQDRIGAYTIESVLAEGAMGRVYRARGPSGDEVALKVFRAPVASAPELRRRLDREIRIAQRLNSRHIAPLIEAGEDAGTPFLVSKFLRGGSLRERLEREGALDLRSVVQLCLELAHALDQLHGAGLVHRNLKPSNVVFDEHGSAHVVDFVLAKDREASVLTKPGQTLGSLDYMAPEQIRGESVSGATDVYALGCLTYECLTGRAPFADRVGMGVLWAHLRDEPPDVRSPREEMPPDVAWAIKRALEKEAMRRPPNATAYARMMQVAAG
jgi:serine/threonine protein kinase